MDKTSRIFGNTIDRNTIRKAERSKQKYRKKFGDDTGTVYHLQAVPISQIREIRMLNLVQADTPLAMPEHPLVVGNIRMGFGHYRISLAIASCAQALGFTPVWFDLASFRATGSEMIRAQNDLYSLGSKLSQKVGLFNKLVWEPMNSEGFRKLTYNAVDQKNAELLVPLYRELPRDVPFVATHAWPAQGAVHAGLTHVVNAIPDNWPMALHLAEGAIHTVQTNFAYLGYKNLHGMARQALLPMPENALYNVGHYVDHEFVAHIEEDCDARIRRAQQKEPVRFLLTLGGAGAGADLYIALVKRLLMHADKKRAKIWINFGDHPDVWETMQRSIPELAGRTRLYRDDYEGFCAFAAQPEQEEADVVAICHEDIFEAVYSTNLLMRHCDVLVTKPSELSFYPVPKLMMRHIGGHEVYGAIHAQEIGDATYECETRAALCAMADSLIRDCSLLLTMGERIRENHASHVYDGGYKAVKLAAGLV